MDKTLVPDRSVTDALYPAVTFVATAVLLAALAVTILILSKSSALKNLPARAKYPILLGTFAYWCVFAVTIVMWRIF